MVKVFTSSAVDRGFEHRSGQTKYYKIGTCSFFPMYTTYKVRANAGWFGIRIMCPSGAPCLSVVCCFSELALLKSS